MPGTSAQWELGSGHAAMAEILAAISDTMVSPLLLLVKPIASAWQPENISSLAAVNTVKYFEILICTSEAVKKNVPIFYDVRMSKLQFCLI